MSKDSDESSRKQPLKKLPPKRRRDAQALLWALRHGFPCTTFFPGAPSYRAAEDLERAGLIKLTAKKLKRWPIVYVASLIGGRKR
jgi:hypothetical protein